MAATAPPPPARMTAPPSTTARIVDVPEAYADVIAAHGAHHSFISADEVDSPWVPFGDNAAIRHLAFDVRQNIFSNVLWIKGPGVIGTHKHRGRLVMMPLSGSVRYLEYDWVATPGSFILEVPGEAHTLVTDHPEGVKLFGWMQGAIEFYDDQARFVETADVFWYIHHYETHCRAHGLPINPKLYI